MISSQDDAPTVEGLFDEAISEYLELSPTDPLRAKITILDRYPQFANELNQFIESNDAVRKITTTFRHQRPGFSGNHLGLYELIERIARGGMGTVWKARHVQLDRFVALKLVNSVFAVEDRVRFQNEVEVVSGLDHPNIVPVYEYGESQDHFFFAMKLIDGPTMASWKPFENSTPENADTKRLAERQIADAIRDIARAIHHAHQRGVLHRDLKPSNVLLDRDGHPYVADFGLAKRNHVDLSMTHTGTVIGTPSYMAPELIFPDEKSLSRQAVRSAMTTAVDIYGLGGILYFLLTGRPPFQGETVLGTLAQVRDRVVTLPTTLNPGIHSDLEAVCLKCLAKDPSDRYESAEALANDLENWIEGKPIVARPAGSLEKLWKWCLRNRRVALLLLISTLATVMSIVSLFWGFRTATIARDEAITHRQTALKNLRTVISEINNLEHIRPDLSSVRYDLMTRIQEHLEPMLTDPVHGNLADETNFWLEVDAGEVQDVRGDFPKARKHFERAMAIARRIESEERPNHERIMSFAHAYMGDALAFSKQAVEGSREHEKSLEIRLKLHETSPTLQARSDLALAHMKNCWAQYFAHDATKDVQYAERGVVHANEAIQRFLALAEEEPENVWHARYLGKSAAAGAECLIRTGRLSEAIEMCEVGVRELGNARTRMPQYALAFDFYESKICITQSYAAWRCGRFALGSSAGARATEVHRRTVEHDDKAFLQRRHLIYAIDLYGQNLQCEGRIQESIDVLREGMELAQGLQHDNPGMHNIELGVQHLREHLTFVLCTDPRFDQETLQLLSDSRNFYHTQWELSKNEANEASEFSAQMLLIEFLMLKGDFAAADRSLQSLKSSHVTDPSPDEIRRAEALAQYERLSRLIQDDGQSTDVVKAKLAELSFADGTMLRLFGEFRGRKEWSILASASRRHFKNANFFYPKFQSVLALGEAIHHLPESEGRQVSVSELNAMIRELRLFGPHVETLLQNSPELSGLITSISTE